jgi:predicted anti-sigma-YlaC factor YlaD
VLIFGEVKQKSVLNIGENKWTPLEIAIWLSALAVTIILGIMVVTEAIGSWAGIVPGAMGVLLALWRYRVEAERKKQTPEDPSG